MVHENGISNICTLAEVVVNVKSRAQEQHAPAFST
jgi:hypothetical protein